MSTAIGRAGRVMACAFALVVALRAVAAMDAPAAPPAPPPLPEGRAGELVERARRAAAAKDIDGALSEYFAAIREPDDYPTKYAIRDEILALPSAPARPMDEREKATVLARIAEERARDVDVKAGRMEGRGALRGAALLWRRLRGLEGVTDDKKQQIEGTLERIARKLCDEATDEEKAEAKTIEGDVKDPEAAFARAHQAADAGKGRAALRVFSAVSYSSFATQDLKDRAREAMAALRRRLVEDVPQAEIDEVDKTWNDPHWSGLGTSVSRQFVFIGPSTFVETIAEPDRLKLDLATVFLGDLVGRDLVHQAGGHRLTIYYKERFDFGGGLASGHRIDIGNKVITKPVANELHFHEVSHCVFDVGMVYRGFVEGIANFGAIFASDAMGRQAQADAAIVSNRRGYKDDYLERRVAYWRIASYAPSCGFLLTPIALRDPTARAGQWAKYRRFFRRLRESMPREPRDAERIRYFAWLWGKTFGFEMLDETARARFPVVPAERDAIEAEIARFADETRRGESEAEGEMFTAATELLEGVLAGCPPGELVDRAKFAMARVKAGREDPAGRDALHRELGVVPAWKLCIPFYSRGVSPLFEVHEPEREIVLDSTYANGVQNSRWIDAKIAPDGRVDLLDHGIGYPDDAAAYALAVLEVPADVPDATCFLGFSETCALWIDGVLVEKWDDSTDWVRDGRVARVPLKAGRNRLLLKVAHGRGAWGFSARVVRADRKPIDGLVFVAPSKHVPALPPKAKGEAVFVLDLDKVRSLPKGKVRATVGGIDVVEKTLRCTVGGSVPWRKYLIAPFVSKDPPTALAWLVDKDLATLADFAVEVATHRRDANVPRVAVTLHGEERDDGLSGHTFVLRGDGDGVDCRLEEYDRLVFRGTVAVAKSPDHVFRFVRRGRTLSCLVDGRPALDAVDLPALPRAGIGVMWWDKETGISRVRVERLK